MRNFVRVIVLLWALASIGLSALAFSVVRGTGGDIAAAAQEAAETIPEAAVQLVGYAGAPIWLTVAYWLALAAALYLSFRPSRRTA